MSEQVWVGLMERIVMSDGLARADIKKDTRMWLLGEDKMYT